MKKNYWVMVMLMATFVSACNNGNPSGLTGIESSNKATTDKLFEAFNKHDWDGYANCYAENADFLDPSYGKEFVKQTHQQLVDKYNGFQKVFPDIRDEVISMYVAGESVVVEFVASGTAPDGTKWKLPICSVLTYKNGKIIRDATYYDEEH